MKLIKLLNKLNYEKQLFVKLLAVIAVPLIAMGIISYYIYIQGESERSEITLKFQGSTISEEYENIFSTLKKYYTEAVYESDLRWLVRQEEVPYEQYSYLKQAQKTLNGNAYWSKYIESYEFINVRHGWVLDKYGLFSFDEVENPEETQQFLQEQEGKVTPVYWLLSEEDRDEGSNTLHVTHHVDITGLRLIIKSELVSGDITWMISVKLKKAALESMLKNYEKMGYGVSILQDKKVLTETSTVMTKAYLEAEQDADMIKTEEGRKYKIIRYTGDASNFSYVIGFDQSSIEKGGLSFVLASFVVLALIVGMLSVIRVLAAAFARPIHQLENHLKDKEVQIQALLAENLIKGEIQKQSLLESLEKAKIEPCASYRMVAMSCKRRQSENMDMQRLFDDMTEALEEILSEIVFISPLFYCDMIIFIVGASDDLLAEDRTALLYTRVKEFIYERSGYYSSCGISQPFHNLTHAHRAYNECREALYDDMNTKEADRSSLVLYDDYSIQEQGSNVYDIIMEAELVQAIENGNEDESCQLLKKMIQRMDVKRGSGIERNYYLVRLLTTLLNIPVQHDIQLKEIFDDEHYDVLNQVQQLYDTNELIAKIAHAIIIPIIQKIQEKKKAEDAPEIILQIMKLIKDKKGNITLNECAELMNYHPNYLSKVLKREMGVTFTEVVGEGKLIQAKYLLLTTELSVKEIAESLQYNNVQNFIRFFKKNTGVTPAVFRKEHSN